MRLRLLVEASWPGGRHKPGEIAEVSDRLLADEWLRTGVAVAVAPVSLPDEEPAPKKRTTKKKATAKK